MPELQKRAFVAATRVGRQRLRRREIINRKRYLAGNFQTSLAFVSTNKHIHSIDLMTHENVRSYWKAGEFVPSANGILCLVTLMETGVMKD